MEGKEFKLKLRMTRKGLPVVRSKDLYLMEVTDNFIIGAIDIKHKWCYIESTFSTGGGKKKPQIGFTLTPSQETREINGWLEGWDPENDYLDSTDVTFVSDEKLEIFMIECSRYTIRFVLRREDKKEARK